VKPLHESPDALGEMNVICQHCSARKFKQEKPSLCCNSGKIMPTPFRSPPEEIKKFFFEDSPEGKLFRKMTRPLNNALCFSSVQAKEPEIKGFNPTVTIQGRVIHRVGSLEARSDDSPVYAQLYTLDSEIQENLRISRLNLDDSTAAKKAEKEM